MENNSFELDVFANEMNMPTFDEDENPIEDDLPQAEEIAEPEMETYAQTSLLVQSVMQLRMKLRFLHLVECEHFRQLEAGVPAFRKMAMSREAGHSCCAKPSLNF